MASPGVDVCQEDVINEEQCADLIIKGFENFKKQWKYGKVVRIDRTTLLDAVHQWHLDLKRYYGYYKPSYYNYKFAAFLMYWIVKTKPIFYPQGEGDPKHTSQDCHTEKYLMVNEYFALDLGLNLLTGVAPDGVSEEVREHFATAFYHRDPDPKFLLLTLKLLFDYTTLYSQAEALNALLKISEVGKSSKK
jgi:hypothetical protein